MLARYFQERNPALIVLAYGSNEASDSNWTRDSYRAMFSALLKRLRNDCPQASVLVLGPADRQTQTRKGPVQSEGLDQIIEAQRLACIDNNCAFWSTKNRMGGSGSMRAWVSAGLGQPDFVHFTPSGYARLAEMLFTDLMRAYGSYREAGSTPSTKRRK
jgi:lysophospholipase L1-like esterase